MSSSAIRQNENPLGYQPIPRLLAKFAIPSIISMLVGALYNIVDQIFIGRGVGMLGNAATNVAFPLTTLCTALALLFGIGSAANFNLTLGAGHTERAARFAGNGAVLIGGCGILLAVVVLLFLKPLMLLFGATPQVLPYALSYTGITAFGIPLLMFSTGMSHLIRADGKPTYSMLCTLSGAILNTILDPIFIFVFDWGIAGAAWATVIGQAVSAVLALRYLFHFRTARLTRQDLRLTFGNTRRIMSLGVASFCNQIAMTIVQVVMNNTLTYYGAQSAYGSDIPLAAVGVISKVNIVFVAIVVGLSQGCQPLFGFNYGAKRYERVRRTYLLAAGIASGVSLVFFACFQLFPWQIISIFGNGSELYFQFAVRYLRTFMMFTFLNGIQPLTGNFFSSIGKATRGLFISMTRQILFLLPLIIVLPLSIGIEGVMYAGPIADVAAFILAVIFVSREMRDMRRLQAGAA